MDQVACWRSSRLEDSSSTLPETSSTDTKISNMDKHAILSALVIGVLAYLITSGVRRLSERGRLGQSKWTRHTLIVVLIFIAALGVKALLG